MLAHEFMFQIEIAKFNEKISRPTKTGCREWLGAKNSDGYGKVTVSKWLRHRIQPKRDRYARHRWKVLAHRMSWWITMGAIPDGMCVLHHCDNPKCVNPDHLFLGNHTDNMRDMMSKGRHWAQKRRSEP